MAVDQVARMNKLIERFAYRTYINILFDVIIISEQQRINYMPLIIDKCLSSTGTYIAGGKYTCCINLRTQIPVQDRNGPNV